MIEIQAMRLTEDAVLKLFALGDPVILVFGRSKTARAYALPIKGWADVIASTYGDIEPEFHITPRKLKEAHIIGLLSRQVGVDFRPLAYGVLRVGERGTGNSYNHTDVAWLVPCCLWWVGRLDEWAELRLRLSLIGSGSVLKEEGVGE